MKKFYNILLSIALVAIAVVGVQAQSTLAMYNSTYTTLATDTATNTGTATVGNVTALKNDGPYTNTVIQVLVTDVSGTTGGTLSLLGSVDGTTYKALSTAETATALATQTPSDATAGYHWRLNGAPFPYYRVQLVGTGTMVSTIAAKIYRSK